MRSNSNLHVGCHGVSKVLKASSLLGKHGKRMELAKEQVHCGGYENMRDGGLTHRQAMLE